MRLRFQQARCQHTGIRSITPTCCVLRTLPGVGPSHVHGIAYIYVSWAARPIFCTRGSLEEIFIPPQVACCGGHFFLSYHTHIMQRTRARSHGKKKKMTGCRASLHGQTSYCPREIARSRDRVFVGTLSNGFICRQADRHVTTKLFANAWEAMNCRLILFLMFLPFFIDSDRKKDLCETARPRQTDMRSSCV